MDAAFFIAFTGFITAIGAIVTALATNKNAATKQELESLRTTIVTLQAENKRMTEDNERLRIRLNDLECERTSNRDRISLLEEQVQELEEQVRKLGAEPVTQKRK